MTGNFRALIGFTVGKPDAAIVWVMLREQENAGLTGNNSETPVQARAVWGSELAAREMESLVAETNPMILSPIARILMDLPASVMASRFPYCWLSL